MSKLVFGQMKEDTSIAVFTLEGKSDQIATIKKSWATGCWSLETHRGLSIDETEEVLVKMKDLVIDDLFPDTILLYLLRR